MNHAPFPLVKLSSIGRTAEQDRANLRYIARDRTAEDQSGNPMSRTEAGKTVKKYYSQIGLRDGEKNSFRLIVSLPREGTSEAREIVGDEISQRYGSYISAFHLKNDKGEHQPHLHFLIFNDMDHHPLRRHREARDLREEIGRRFHEAGIGFSKMKNPEKNKTQAAIHARGREEIEREMSSAVEFALGGRDFEDFEERLGVVGVSMARETKSGVLTLANEQGYKCRLHRLTSGAMSTREDVLTFLQQKEEHNMEKEQEVMERGREAAEQAACWIWNGRKNTAEATEIAEKIKKKKYDNKGVRDTYKNAKKHGVDLRGVVSCMKPDLIRQAGEGNPLPLIISLSRGIAAAITAAQAIKEKTYSRPGLSLAQGRESLLAPGRKPAPELSADHIVPKGPGR